MGVDAAAHEALTDSGERVGYDALAVATGARPVEAVPGALTFAGPKAVEPMRELVERAASGEFHTLVFALAKPAVSWPLPVYELALMTASRSPSTRMVLATAERMPLELFGSAVSDAVGKRLARAGVVLATGVAPRRVRRRAPSYWQTASRSRPTPWSPFPRSRWARWTGLPQVEGGFMPVDEHGRVEGIEDVYAAGDVTAFPVKQGGVTVRQAQAVAECLAARAGAPVAPEPFEPLLRGVMLTGGEPSYLQSGAGGSLLASSPLWWPPTKIADSYLVPYLVARFQLSIPTLPGAGEADLVSSTPAGDDVPARPRADT